MTKSVIFELLSEEKGQMLDRIFGKKRAGNADATQQPAGLSAEQLLDLERQRDQAATDAARAKGLLPNEDWEVRGGRMIHTGGRRPFVLEPKNRSVVVTQLPLGRRHISLQEAV